LGILQEQYRAHELSLVRGVTYCSPSQKIRTQDLCLLGKKKGVDPSFRTLFWKKTFFFGWRQGSAPLHYGFASVPLRSAPAANQKKNFFPEQRSKLGQLLFFFPTGKDP